MRTPNACSTAQPSCFSRSSRPSRPPRSYSATAFDPVTGGERCPADNALPSRDEFHAPKATAAIALGHRTRVGTGRKIGCQPAHRNRRPRLLLWADLRAAWHLAADSRKASDGVHRPLGLRKIDAPALPEPDE